MELVYLTLQATGQGQAAHAHVHEIVRGLRRRGWSIRLHQVHYSGNPSAPRRLLTMLAVQLRAVSRPLPETVYIRWHFAALPFALFAWLRGRQIVQEVNGNYNDIDETWPLPQTLVRLLRWSMAWQLRHAHLVISVTEQLSDWVSSIAPNVRRAVVTNGADLELFHPRRANEEIADLPDRYVVFFGAFSPWQGIGTMLKATSSQHWPSGVSLAMVGNGIQRDEVSNATASGRVAYLGQLPYEQIGPVVAQSLASLIIKEGASARTGVMPLKLFESLGSGVPVIVSDFPGLRDVALESGAGLVVPPEDAEQLARAVAQLAAKPEGAARMGSAGRVWAEQGHSWDARAARTDELLRGLTP